MRDHLQNAALEDRLLESCLRHDETIESLYSNQVLDLTVNILEKRMAGQADWYSVEDVESMTTLYERSKSWIVRFEIESTLEFITKYSRDGAVVQLAQVFLNRREPPIVDLVRKRILERN